MKLPVTQMKTDLKPEKQIAYTGENYLYCFHAIYFNFLSHYKIKHTEDDFAACFVTLSFHIKNCNSKG